MRSNRRNVWVGAMILAAGLSASGCQQFRADNKLKSTNKTLAEIEEKYDGKTHNLNAITGIRSQLDAANQQLAADPGAALVTASAAQSAAEQLLEEVRPKQGIALFTKAQDEIRVADINDLSRIDPPRYKRVKDVNTEMETAKQENKWDDVIRLASEIITEVNTGLSTLKNQSDRKKIDSEQALTELKQIGGNTYVPEVVIGVQDDLARASNIAEKDRDYVAAANKFAEAKVRAEQGIEQVRREQSREKIEQIEGLLTSAIVEGVKQFKPQDYEDSNRILEQLVTNYNEGKFTTVLEGADILIPRAQTLVIETKRAASDDRISTMQRNINELQDGGVLEYLPGSLDRMRQFLATAQETRKRNVEEAFDEIKKTSIDALDEFDRVRRTFQTLAVDRISEAKGGLETARAVFDQMDTIFDPIQGDMDSDQKAFEGQKESRKLQLGKQIEEANTKLVTADLRQQDGKFKGAIVLSEEVKRGAQEILSEVYHVVGHNASIELAKLISRYERDGARQYSPDELSRSTVKLEQVKKAIQDRRYQQSVELAAEARADVELMAQRIAGRATEDLREARTAFSSAASEKTRKYRSTMLDEVGSLIEKAEQDLQAARLKLALETANRATQLARQAQREADQLSADETLKLADSGLREAQDAGAEVYAGREVEDARKLLQSSRALYSTDDFAKSEELAAAAAARAKAALFKRITEAETEIASAKAVGGWEYDDARLASANTKVREARMKLDAKQYADSRSLAESARDAAIVLTRDAKANTFNQRVARIQDNLEIGTRQGVNFFQPEESIEARRQLAQLMKEFTPKDYERIMSEIEKLEASLRMTLDSTGSLVYKVADQQTARADKLAADGGQEYAAAELAEAKSRLEYARLDYRRGHYKGAHSNLDAAIKLLNEVDARAAYDRYTVDMLDLFRKFEDLQFGFKNVLTLDASELKELATSTDGGARAVSVSTQISPGEFRSGVDVLYSRALGVQAPAGLENTHASVIQAMNYARLAALRFERLAVLNRVSKERADFLIDEAYMNANMANEIVARVRSSLATEVIRHRTVTGEARDLVQQGR